MNNFEELSDFQLNFKKQIPNLIKMHGYLHKLDLSNKQIDYIQAGEGVDGVEIKTLTRLIATSNQYRSFSLLNDTSAAGLKHIIDILNPSPHFKQPSTNDSRRLVGILQSDQSDFQKAYQIALLTFENYADIDAGLLMANSYLYGGNTGIICLDHDQCDKLLNIAHDYQPALDNLKIAQLLKDGFKILED